MCVVIVSVADSPQVQTLVLRLLCGFPVVHAVWRYTQHDSENALHMRR